jgi:hypothetical protein
MNVVKQKCCLPGKKACRLDAVIQVLGSEAILRVEQQSDEHI